MSFKPFAESDLPALVQHALDLAKTISDWLPIEGDAIASIDFDSRALNWRKFQLAAKHYVVCERLRNPDRFPFEYRVNLFTQHCDSPAALAVCKILDEIAERYQWQSFSDGPEPSEGTFFNMIVPPIHRSLLVRLERAAAALQRVARSSTHAATDPALVTEKPKFTGDWKHLYEFLRQQQFDHSQLKTDYLKAFERYRTRFSKAQIRKGKRRELAHKMPMDTDAKTIRQGYRRQLKRHNASQ